MAFGDQAALKTLRGCSCACRRQLRVVIAELSVRDAMTRQVVTVRADANLRELQALIGRWGLDVVPVVIRDEEGSMRRLSGIVTRSDLVDCLLGARSFKSLEQRRDRPVASLLRAVEPLEPTDRLADAARRLVDERLPALPVSDGRGRVAGILSLSDVLARTDRAARSTRAW